MIKQLRIKCPSCGIILEVTNSKNEALKRIVCPKCKKHLEVDFQDKSQTQSKSLCSLYYGEMRINLNEGINQIELHDFDDVEIKVVQLKDGSIKCIIRPLNENCLVTVNNETLKKDDAVVLSEGDYVKAGDSVLTYGTPLRKNTLEKLDTSEKSHSHFSQWAIACLALLVVLGAIWQFWPHKSEEFDSEIVLAVKDDSVRTDRTIKQEQKIVQPVSSDAKHTKVESKGETIGESHSISEYDLEQLALKGDVEAQFVLGYRLIHKSGANSIVKGIKYLQLAASHGSSQARDVLQKALISLRQKAENGDSVAYYIIMSI